MPQVPYHPNHEKTVLIKFGKKNNNIHKPILHPVFFEALAKASLSWTAAAFTNSTIVNTIVRAGPNYLINSNTSWRKCAVLSVS